MEETNSTPSNRNQQMLSVADPSSDSHPVSPLEPLDPHRLRDMVVDKQGSGSHAASLPSNWSSPQSTQIGIAESPSQIQTIQPSAPASALGAVQSPAANLQRQFSQTGQNSPRTTPQHSVQSPFAPPAPHVNSTVPSNASPYSTSSTTSQQQFMQYGMHGAPHNQIPSSPITSPGPSSSPQTYGMLPGMHARMMAAYPATIQQMNQYSFGASQQWIQQQQVPAQYVQQRVAQNQQQQGQLRVGLTPVRPVYPNSVLPTQPQVQQPQSAAVGEMQPHTPVTSTPTALPAQPTPQIHQGQFIATQQPQQPLNSVDYPSAPPVFMIHPQRLPPSQQQTTVAASFGPLNPQQQQQLQQQMYYQQFSRHQLRGVQPNYPMVTPIATTQIPQLIAGSSPATPMLQVQAIGTDGFAQPQMVRYAAVNGEQIGHPLPLSTLQPQQSPISPAPYRQPALAYQQPSMPVVTGSGVAMRSPTIVSPISANVPINIGQVSAQCATPVPHQPPGPHHGPYIPQQPLPGGVVPPGANSNNAQVQLPNVGMSFHPRTSNQFYGVEVLGGSKHSPNICLAGCVFLIFDDFLPTQVDRSVLTAIIRYHGGDVEVQTTRGIPERVTHVVCATVGHSDIVMHQALSDRRKRLVTLQWLNETIMKKRVEAPSKACHLPSCYHEHNRPAFGKVIALAGFDGTDLVNLRSMLRAVGATYTNKISAQCHILIAKSGGCSEMEMIRQMSLPVHVVNYQWLAELYFGNVRTLAELDSPNYSPLNPNVHCENVVSPYVLERFSEFCQKLMYPWKLPIQLNAESIERACELKKAVENDKTIFPHLSFTFTNDAPSEAQISEAISVLNISPNKIRVHFDGFTPEQYDNLTKKLRFLGGEVCETVDECTHFVAPNLERTVKLVLALALGKNVVSPSWIFASYSLLRLTSALEYFIHDPVNERKYGFNLKNTILHSRHHKIFKNVTFHLSPSVEPSFKIMHKLIISAGGTIDQFRPKRKFLAQCIQADQTYFVVVNDNDLAAYNYLAICGFPLFTEEFVIMSILRHEIFTSLIFRVPVSYNIQKLAATNDVAQQPPRVVKNSPVAAGGTVGGAPPVQPQPAQPQVNNSTPVKVEK